MRARGLVCLALGAVAARAAYAGLTRRPPGGAATWTRTNHCGEPLTLLEGPAVAAAASAAGAAVVPGRLRAAALLAGLGSGALGAYDDLAGTGDSRGFKGHLGALARGQVTSGAVKILGIGATGLAAAALARSARDAATATLADASGAGPLRSARGAAASALGRATAAGSWRSTHGAPAATLRSVRGSALADAPAALAFPRDTAASALGGVASALADAPARAGLGSARGAAASALVGASGALRSAGSAASAFGGASGARSGRSGLLMSVVDVVIDGGVIAGGANLLNLFDLRPGRAVKVAALAGAPLAVSSGPGGAVAAATLGSAAALLNEDLGERAMLGDAGANALGALLGLATVATLPRAGRVAALTVIAGLTAASEVVSFTKVIEATPPLHRIDMLGRRPAASRPRDPAPEEASGVALAP